MLEGVHTKVRRARVHFAELQDVIAEYLESEPFRVQKEVDTKAGVSSYVLHIEREPPPKLSAIGGDVIHNLRTALDHLAHALVKVNSGSPKRYTEFPIATKRKDLSSLVKGKLKGASKRAREITKRFRPYKGGTEGFWELRELDNRDKHRLLVTLGVGSRSVVLDFSEDMRRLMRESGHMDPDSVPDMPIGIRPADPVARDGEPVFQDKSGRGVDSFKEVQLTVVLDEPDIVDCQPLDDGLHQLGRFIEHVVQVYERSCFP